MSEKQQVLDELKQAKQLLGDIKRIETKLSKYTASVFGTTKNSLLILLILGILYIGITSDGSVRGNLLPFLLFNLAVLVVILYIYSAKLTKIKLDENKDQINELTQKKKEMQQSLTSLNIGSSYLEMEILNKFEYYVRNNLAGSLKECAQEYVRELEREEQMNELKKIQANQDKLLDELNRIKEN
ncbi:MAG TPA: hypothetical protein VNR61_04415 [Niallia sp.]|nr:hypothetical protein [Niallia sp.]HWK23973.1 hypothetical protein [Ureibacillus sp.]